MPRRYGEWRYVPGDFWRLDDRTGFKVRSSRQRKEWEGLWVSKEVYEERHPQDAVRGRVDDQTVINPRPRPAHDVFIQLAPAAPNNGYQTEDLSAFYTAEDGTSIYVTES